MRINTGARLAPLRVNGMPNIPSFIIRSVSLGIGLAMDAFSVSVTDGLKETNMSRARALFIAGIYGGFQFLMPLLGWGCVKLLEQAFTAFQPFVPWIALGLLLFLGGRMVREGLCRGPEAEEEGPSQGQKSLATLLLQGLATSIDALSVGFTISEYSFKGALGAALIIGLVTAGLCLVGLRLGRYFGGKIVKQACILGGIILILVGVEIVLSHL